MYSGFSLLQAEPENLRLYHDALNRVFPVDNAFLMMKVHIILRSVMSVQLYSRSREPARVYINNRHAGILVWLSASRAMIKKRACAPAFFSYEQLLALAIDCRLSMEKLPQYFNIPVALAPFVPPQYSSQFDLPLTWLKKQKGKLIRANFRTTRVPRSLRQSLSGASAKIP